MVASSSDTETGLVFKGRMMTLTIVEIRETDCERIAALIDQQLARAPGFFTRLPVLISLPARIPDLSQVIAIMAEASLVVVGVVDPTPAAAEAARRAELGIIRTPGHATAVTTEAPIEQRPLSEAAGTAHEATDPLTTESPTRTPTRLVTRPVRSGQQIYARGGDLVIAAAVSEGAEILADGHIHVYGPLRGRALAGASGDETARIYCRRFEPDLVAIAGRYKVADAMDEDLRSMPVQVRLDNDHLLIELQE